MHAACSSTHNNDYFQNTCLCFSFPWQQQPHLIASVPFCSSLLALQSAPAQFLSQICKIIFKSSSSDIKNALWGWHRGTAGKATACDWADPLLIHLPVNSLGKEVKDGPSVWGLCHPCRRSAKSSWLLDLDQFSPSCCSYWQVNQQLKDLCLLSFSAFL